MKKLQQQLTVGQEFKGLDMYVSLNVDGEQKRRFKAESFVGNFAEMLNAFMHGGLRTIPVPNAGNVLPDRFHPSVSVSGATNTTPIELSTSDGGWFTNIQDFDYVYVWGVKGNTAANGWHKAKKVDDNTVKLYDEGENPLAGNGAYTSGGRVQTMGYREGYIRSNDFSGTYDVGRFAFNQWQVIVGAGSQAVDVNDKYLKDRIPSGSGDGLLSHGTRSVSAVVTDKPTSRFTISKPFTNQGTTDISINEMGIVSQGDYDNPEFQNVQHPALLMVRDVLGAALTVGAGSTLTVDYELVVRLDPDTQDTATDGTNGGFLDDFMAAIRDMAANGNNTQAALFNMAATAGNMGADGPNETYNGFDFGIRLGTDNTFTSMTDSNVLAPIPHGAAAGQLWYYGMNVEKVAIDGANNTATYKVNRIIENRSGGSITIQEIALFGNRRDSDVYNGGFTSPVILARTALASADQLTIADGEFAQIEYTIEIIS